MISKKDKTNFRELMKEYAEIAFLDVHQKTIKRWKRFNGLKDMAPMMMIDQIPWNEMNVHDELTLKCEDLYLQGHEFRIRKELYKWKHFPCDMVISPYFPLQKVFSDTGIGVKSEYAESDQNSEHALTHTFKDQLCDMAALEKLHFPIIQYDKEKSMAQKEEMEELIGDIIPVRLNGIGIWAAVWDEIVLWRGAEAVLYDFMDRPEFVHALMKKIMSIKMNTLDQYERENLLEPMLNIVHCAGAYTDELPGEDFNENHTLAKNCWAAGAAQIFSEISPAMHDEFEIAYLKPYYERFGLVNYGCCEPLHHKIDIVSKIKNIRTISFSPWANVEIAAECMGKKYIMARKPNPSVLAMDSFDAKEVEKDIVKTLKACANSGTPCEFILKDISTVKNDPQRLTQWYQVVKSTIDSF